MSTKTHLQDLTYEKKPTKTNLREQNYGNSFEQTRELIYEAHLRDLPSTKTYLQELTYEI